MIKFNRDGKQVKMEIEVRTVSYGTRLLNWWWNCNEELYADLLAKQLRDLLWNWIKEDRRKQYEQGWKDAKAKKVKNNYFSGYMGD